MPIYPTDEFEKYLVTEYFKHGSINKVFYFHHFNLPISYAGYDRVLTKYGIIKSAGPNSKLTESLGVLSLVADYKLSLEKIYEKYAPQTIRVSTNTLHRILHYTRLGLIRRQGVALIISPKKNKNLFLIGKDNSLSRTDLGQKGDLSLPMGHAKTGESPRDSIIRVLQQEVFTDLVLTKEFPYEVVPEHPKPIMYMNIADICVSVFHLSLIGDYPFSSFKLSNLNFRSLEQIKTELIRPGVEDILGQYSDILYAEIKSIPRYSCSLNLALAKVENQ